MALGGKLDIVMLGSMWKVLQGNVIQSTESWFSQRTKTEARGIRVKLTFILNGNCSTFGGAMVWFLTLPKQATLLPPLSTMYIGGVQIPQTRDVTEGTFIQRETAPNPKGDIDSTGVVFICRFVENHSSWAMLYHVFIRTINDGGPFQKEGVSKGVIVVVCFSLFFSFGGFIALMPSCAN